MKTLKKFSKSTALLLAYVFIVQMIYSCSVERESISSHEVMTQKYEGIFEKLDTDSKLLKAKMDHNLKNIRLTDGEITQELIDEYAVELGYEAGFIQLEVVNTAIEASGYLAENGFEVSVNTTNNLEDFVKQNLIDVSNDNFINLSENTEFQNLPEIKKELLVFANVLKTEMNNQETDAAKLNFGFSFEDCLYGTTIAVVIGLSWPVAVGVGIIVGILTGTLK